MVTDPPASPQPRMNAPMDDKKMEAALSWLEKCIAIISTLFNSNFAAALILLRFIRPTASFLFVLVGDFSQLAVVLLRIVARYAEIAAGVLESVNEKYFRRDPTTSLGDNEGEQVPTSDNNSTEKQPSTPSRPQEPSLASEKMTASVSNAIISTQKKKQRKKSDSKKALGKAKILQLREHRLKMGLKVASKADAC